MPRNPGHCPEVPERAIRMVMEHPEEDPCLWVARASVASRLGGSGDVEGQGSPGPD